MSDQPTFYVWFDTFEPQENHLDEDASFEGCLFEAYGEELEYVREVHAEDARRVWTLVEVDGDRFITAGFRRVNALGYFVTSQPLEDEDEERRQLYLDQDIPVDE